MISFRGVSRRFANGESALRNVSFDIEPGELVFVTGPSGAGKSTLLRLVAMLDVPTSGSIRVGGIELATLRRRQVPYFRRNIGFVFQDHRLLFDRSVFDNVALPLQVSEHSSGDIRRRVRAALDKVGLLRRENASPVTLSTGEQQRVGIARAIAHRPPLLIADEPTGNLDPALSLEIFRLFLAFNEVGTTVLIVTHDTDLIGRFSVRTLRLNQGELESWY